MSKHWWVVTIPNEMKTRRVIAINENGVPYISRIRNNVSEIVDRLREQGIDAEEIVIQI